MRIDTSADILTFIISLLTGFGLAVIYIVFKAFRKTFKSGTVTVVFQDILFSLILSIITFTLLFVRVYGEMRWFVIVPEFIGFSVTKLFFEKYIIKPFIPIFKIIKKAVALLKMTFIKLSEFLNKIYDKISIKFLKKS